MAKGKSKKVDYKDVKARYNNGELIGTVTIEDEETHELVQSDINLTVEMKDLLASLLDEETISINIKKFKPMTAKDKVITYKYHCKCEDPREIKSKCDYLNIHCNDCDEDFQIEDK